jgi:nicotinamide riboside kinase
MLACLCGNSIKFMMLIILIMIICNNVKWVHDQHKRAGWEKKRQCGGKMIEIQYTYKFEDRK